MGCLDPNCPCNKPEMDICCHCEDWIPTGDMIEDNYGVSVCENCNNVYNFLIRSSYGLEKIEDLIEEQHKIDYLRP